jgi:REP element-mobilizing transposase RayT
MSIFYDPYSPREVSERNLPHWSQSGRLHFVTFRLADSIPLDRLQILKTDRQAWFLRNTQPLSPDQWKEYHSLFSEHLEGWLDDHTGDCHLARSECADIVAEALEYFHGTRYDLDHWVIMPNHVHTLVMPLEPYPLSDILHSWKSFTSHKLNKLMARSGNLWQKESFDHIVRSEPQLVKLRNYIIENSAKAAGRARLSTQVVTS